MRTLTAAGGQLQGFVVQRRTRLSAERPREPRRAPSDGESRRVRANPPEARVASEGAAEGEREVDVPITFLFPIPVGGALIGQVGALLTTCCC